MAEFSLKMVLIQSKTAKLKGSKVNNHKNNINFTIDM